MASTAFRSSSIAQLPRHAASKVSSPNCALCSYISASCEIETTGT